MLQLLFGVIVDVVLEGVGWGVLKALSLGRYRGKPDDIWLRGTIGFVTIAACGYGAYLLWT